MDLIDLELGTHKETCHMTFIVIKLRTQTQRDMLHMGRRRYIVVFLSRDLGIPYHFRAINFPGKISQSLDFPGNPLFYLLI